MANGGIRAFWNVALFLLPPAFAVVQRASDINCDFDTDACGWKNGRNVTEDETDWRITDSLVIDVFTSIPRGALGQGDSFAFVRSDTSLLDALRFDLKPITALLISDVINCQLETAQLQYHIWKATLTGALDVCIRHPPNTHGRLECVHTTEGFLGWTWRPITVSIPPVSSPFQIVFRARLLTPADIVAIDHITYESSSICGSNGKESGSSKQPVPSKRAESETATVPLLSIIGSPSAETNFLASNSPFDVDTGLIQELETAGFGTTLAAPSLVESVVQIAPNNSDRRQPPESRKAACSQAECDFEQDYCEFDTFRAQQNQHAMLRRHCGTLLRNADFRTPDGNCSLVFTTTKDSQLAALVSTGQFLIKEPSELRFSYLLLSNDRKAAGTDSETASSLAVCVDGIDNCVWEATANAGEQTPQWRKQSVVLGPGTRRVFFVFQQFQRGTRVALDDVRLFNIPNAETDIGTVDAAVPAVCFAAS